MKPYGLEEHLLLTNTIHVYFPSITGYVPVAITEEASAES